jgi:hypothetical protein
MPAFVVFSKNTGAIRREVVSDLPYGDFRLHVGPGEEILQHSIDGPAESQGARLRALIRAHSGKEGIPALFATTDEKGVVTAIFEAEDGLDKTDGLLRLRTQDVGIGWTHRGDGSFDPPPGHIVDEASADDSAAPV